MAQKSADTQGQSYPSVFAKLPAEKQLAVYRTMSRIRQFETNAEQQFLNGNIPGFLHLYIGEEATAAGVMANLNTDDFITSTHRGHGHTVAKGADVKRMMAELYGKATGLCKGKGGSMHIADFTIGMLGANGIVGGGFNIALGAAMSSWIKKSKQVAVSFFGDGASNRGTFHEAVNWAALFKLPVVFVNENNHYASTTPIDYGVSVPHVAARSCAYGIPGIQVDGNDAEAVYDAAHYLIERARSGEGPALLECETYRVKGHYVGDPEKYRTKDEVREWQEKHDPLRKFRDAFCTSTDLVAQADAIDAEEKALIEEAITFAEESPFPAAEDAMDDLFSFSPAEIPPEVGK